jgi:cytochrome c6
MKNITLCLFALLVLLAACSKKGVATKEPHIKVEALFADNCARCHGADGKTGRAPDLSRCTLDTGGLVNIISKGEGHMPAFGDKLNSKEIEAMSNFVMALRK